jgi:hypothetical protein
VHVRGQVPRLDAGRAKRARHGVTCASLQSAVTNVSAITRLTLVTAPTAIRSGTAVMPSNALSPDAAAPSHRDIRPLSATRQLLLLLLVLGSTVSLLASGRLSVRLIVDGAVSFAFIPALELLALYVVVRRWRERVSFRAVLGAFLAGNQPWLYWLVAIGAVFSVVPPRAIGFVLIDSVAASAIVPFAWALRLDVRFFTDEYHRSAADAVRDALLHRVIGWGLGLTYFFGIAIWSLTQPTFARWLGQ